MILKRLLIVAIAIFFGASVQAMTATIQKDPALVLVAFGTTTDARVTFDYMTEQVKKNSAFKGLKLSWAFTSEIVRERANAKFKKARIHKKYLSLPQVLANLESEGYRKVVVQPLHIFPGQEYDEAKKVVEAFRTIGLRIEFGKTLYHEWPQVHAVLHELEKEFIPESKGCNVIVTHGTPHSFQGANSTYLGLERYISQTYKNVYIGAVEGILTRKEALDKAKQCKQKQIRFISSMLVSGDHVSNDIMGEEPDEEGEISWALEMKRAGFKTEALTATYKGKTVLKGLGLNKGVVDMFLRGMERALTTLQTH